MVLGVRHWKAREWRFVGLLGASLVLIGGYLGTGLRGIEQVGGGWRRVDSAVIERLMDQGELSIREADWYHPSGADKGRFGPGGGND